MLPETGGTEFGKDLDQAVAEVDVVSRTGDADLETEGDLIGKTDVERLGDFSAEFLQEPGFEFGPFRFGDEDLDAMFVAALPVEAGQELLDHLRQEFAVAKERLQVLLDHGIDDDLLQTFLNHDEEVASRHIEINIHLLPEVVGFPLCRLPDPLRFSGRGRLDPASFRAGLAEEILRLDLCGRKNLFRQFTCDVSQCLCHNEPLPLFPCHLAGEWSMAEKIKSRSNSQEAQLSSWLSADRRLSAKQRCLAHLK